MQGQQAAHCTTDELQSTRNMQCFACFIPHPVYCTGWIHTRGVTRGSHAATAELLLMGDSRTCLPAKDIPTTSSRCSAAAPYVHSKGHPARFIQARATQLGRHKKMVEEMDTLLPCVQSTATTSTTLLEVEALPCTQVLCTEPCEVTGTYRRYRQYTTPSLAPLPTAHCSRRCWTFTV